MRVALCFSGMVRTLVQTYPSIRQHLLEPFKPDVFVHTYDKMGLRKENDLPVSETWLKGLLQPVLSRIVPFEEADLGFKQERDRLYQYPGPIWTAGVVPESWWKLANVMSQFWHVRECDRLRQAHEETQGFRYDLVIRARMDNLFGATPDPLGQHGLRAYPMGTVFVADHAAYGGLCDQFAMGEGESMRAYCDYYSRFEEVYRSRVLLPRYYGASEALLKRYVEKFTDLKALQFRVPFELQRESEVYVQSEITDDYFHRQMLKEVA